MRKSNRRKLKTKNSKSKINFFVLLSLIILVLGLAFLIMFKVFMLPKFIYVNKTENGGAEIIIIDSSLDKELKYLIPYDTELNSARNYGTYKMSSLWILSEKNSIGGKLIAETVTKNYFLPIYLWRDNTRSNLSLLQRIKIFFTKRNSLGYEATIMSTNLPNSILINFINPSFTDFIPKIEVEDLTGNIGIIGKISNIIEVIGGKITSNSKGYDENLNCEISGRDENVVRIFSEVLNCDEVKNELTNTDLRIRLGAKFVDRF